MNKKRYLFLYGPLNSGGAERVLLDILRNFDYSLNEVHLCQFCGGGTLIDEVPSAVKKHSMWSGYNIGYKLAIRASLKFSFHWLLRRRFQKAINACGDFDVVISFLEGMPLRIQYLTNTIKSKQVTWVHCDLLRFPYTNNQFRSGEQLTAYNAMDTIVCVAEDTERAFKERFPRCLSETKVIYNPIDISKIERMSDEICVDNNRFTIVMAGRLTFPKKAERFALIAKRFKDLGRTDILFQWIGDGELRNEVEHQIRELGVEDMVQILGFKRNPFPYIKAADMMFCCSGYEGFCLAVCEAMVLGIPVVSTKTSGPIEIIDNDKYGILCDHDEDSMFKAVFTMANNMELRNYYAHVGKERVKKYAVEECMKQIYQL